MGKPCSHVLLITNEVLCVGLQSVCATLVTCGITRVSVFLDNGMLMVADTKRINEVNVALKALHQSVHSGVRTHLRGLEPK